MSDFYKKSRKTAIGTKTNMLTVISEKRIRCGNRNRWVLDCICDCGNTVTVFQDGNTKSCGCIKLKYKERVKSAFIRNSWEAMKNRCLNPKNHNYIRYGAKGVKICERWMLFKNFYDDTEATWAKGLSLDRFPNNEGNYEPTNFRWATMLQQGQNKSGNKLNATIAADIRSSLLSAKELGIKFNVHEETIRKVRKNIRWANISA